MSYETNLSSRSSSTNSWCIGYGDTINDTIESVEGDRNMLITDLRPGYFDGSSKLEPCETMTVIGVVRNGYERVPISIRLFLHRGYTKRLSDFFRCFGLKRAGEPFTVDFSNVIGKSGRVHIREKHFIGDDGHEHVFNEVDKFFDFDPSFFEDDEPVYFTEMKNCEDFPA